jgi:hypothetical protein
VHPRVFHTQLRGCKDDHIHTCLVRTASPASEDRYYLGHLIVFNGAVSYGDQFRVLLWLKPAWANVKRLWDGMGPELRFRKWLAAVLLIPGPPSAAVGTILLLDYAAFPQHSNLWIASLV